MSNYILCHHGIKGQKWGVRRFQKKDGSLTSAGKKRYSDDEGGNVSETKTRKEKAVKAAKVGAAVAGTALAAYGAKKVHDYVRDKNTQIHIKKAQKLTDDWMSKKVGELFEIEKRTGKLDYDAASAMIKYKDKSLRRNDIVNGRMAAKNDKFSTAAKNVAFDYLEKRKYYR